MSTTDNSQKYIEEKLIWQEHEVTVILTSEALSWARLFAMKQPDVETGKRVYLNTLAVCAVQFFLERHGIETDLEDSDCWYPNLATPFDVADLVLPGIGSVECRPVIGSESEIKLPELEWDERVTFIAVRFGEFLDRAHILCYFPAFAPDDFIPDAIPLDSPDRKPINELVAHLRAGKAIVDVFKEHEDIEMIEPESEDIVFTEVQPWLELYSRSAIAFQLERIFKEESDRSLQTRRVENLLSDITSKAETTERELVLRGIELRGLQLKGSEQDLTDEEVDEDKKDIANRFGDRVWVLFNEKLQNLDDAA